MSPHAPSIPEGTLVAGKYRVAKTIGRGGMGVVLEAMHGPLAQPVALKVLSAEALASEDIVGRFLREARAAAGLKSEYVARVTDYGALDDGRPFMAMELLEGEDLGVALSRELPLQEVIDAMVQACAGLAEAHAAGIVHRDLKPSNLFRTRRPDGSHCTKVLDFGISKVTERANVPTPQTSTRSMLGTPLYMSPEQVRNAKTVDARTDVWSLGIVLYEALAGRPPFLGETLGEVFAAILQDDPPPLTAATSGRREVPVDLERTVMACLTKRADDRIASVKELALRLAPHGSLEGRLVAQRVQAIGAPLPAPRALEISDPTSMETLLAPDAEKPAEVRAPALSAARAVDLGGATPPAAQTLSGSVVGQRRRRTAPALGLAALGIVVAVGAFAVTRPSGGPGPVPAVSAIADQQPGAITAATGDRPGPEPVVLPSSSAAAAPLPAASSSTPAPDASVPAPRSPASPSGRSRPPATSPASTPSPPPSAPPPPPSAKPRRTLD